MRTVLVFVVLASTLAAQLTDLQPGRNFPTHATSFGTGFSENVDAGDIDNDGDMDVVVGNGGDFGKQANRLYINNGGLQGGTVGTFSDGTTRLNSPPIDSTRDVEFVDIDNDGDLDIYVSNRGTGTTGEVSRFYINQGGFQEGTIGFFQEDTNNRWGTLSSVPVGDQVFGGNQGSWRDWSCDCDFADLDDDGDTDLFHNSYGPNINGTTPFRVFLNDGTGVYNELSPWVNASADIETHSLDIDLADFDGDFDIDVVASSRDSQARVYHNNLYDPLPGTTEMFSDITQRALLDGGLVMSGGGNYEAEYGDADGDGDFDIWFKNLSGNLDRIGRNDGPLPAGGFGFTQVNSLIVGDPNVDENEVDFGDYDGDGDLDMMVGNFSGQNWMYQSGVAQGYSEAQGLFHRTGGGGSDAAGFPELANFNDTTLDADWCDVDNDGDEDIISGTDGGASNRLDINVLGIPDTHAPVIQILEDVGDKANGTSSVVHAQIRDNSSYYITNFYDANLIYCVNGGSETTLDMFAQGSMQYRAVIPAQTDSTVSYRVEVTDLAGNTGVSDTMYYRQGVAFVPYADIGFAKAGVSGNPVLAGTGDLIPGEPMSIELSNAATSEPCLLFMSVESTPGPFKGGTLAANPPFLDLGFTTGAGGDLSLPFVWVEDVPCGFQFWLQFAIRDTAATAKTSLSNALEVTSP